MATTPRHCKKDSRSSRTFYPGGLWRSLGRARAWHALDTSTYGLNVRANSSLCCGPDHPTANPVVDTDSTACGYPPSSTTSFGSLRTLRTRSARENPQNRSNGLPRRGRPRPLSWLSFVKSKASYSNGTMSSSMTLPQPASMSTISKKSISSPVLTSTTNSRVADTEDVECSDILLSNYSSRIPASSRNLQTTGSVTQEEGRSSGWSSTIRSVKNKLSHTRRASTSLLLENPWIRQAARRKGSLTSTPTQERPCNARLKTEIEVQGAPSQTLLIGTTRKCLGQAQIIPYDRRPPRLPDLSSDSTTDLLVNSLSKSFASAVEKLDFHSSPTLIHDGTPVSRLQKAKSYFSLHRISRDSSLRSLVEGRTDVVGCKESTGFVTTHSRPGLVPHKTDAVSMQSEDLEPQHMRPTQKISTSRLKLPYTKPIQLRWSGLKNRYVHTKADTRRTSKVNPLRMHPEVTAFAKPPPNGSEPATPGQAYANRNEDELNHGRIDRAVIYSPSTGDLSEYSRRTPSIDGGAGLRDRKPQDTPTRKPLHRTSGAMLKKSVSTLLGRSASMMKLGSLTPSKKARSRDDLQKSDKRASWHNDEVVAANSCDSQGQRRATSTQDIYNTENVKAVWDHRPTTPSPLRKSTKLSTTSRGRPRAVTTTTPVRDLSNELLQHGQRSATVLSDSKKRYARIMNPSAAGRLI